MSGFPQPIAASSLPGVEAYNVAVYGATGNGVTDDTAAINRALAAMSPAAYGTAGTGGILFFPPGVYKISSGLTAINNPAISIMGAGSDAVIIQPTAAVTGDVLRIQCEIAGAYVGTKAGTYQGFTIDGTNAGIGACGIHFGDTLGGTFVAVAVQNFTITGSVGFKMDNNTYWTERTTMIACAAKNNRIGIQFQVSGTGTGSFEFFNCINFQMNVNAAQTGWLMLNTAPIAVISHGFLGTTGNYGGTGAIFISLASGSGGAWSNLYCQISGDGGSGTGLSIGASDNLQQCSGFIDFGNGTSVDSNGFSTFTGHFNCPGISTPAGDNHFVNGRGPTVLGNSFSFYSQLWSGTGNPNSGTGPFQFVSAATGDRYFDKNSNATWYCTAGGVSPGTWVTTVATVPPTNATIQTALGNLILGTAYQNTLAYDVRLTVYLSVTVNTSGVVKLGVGTTNTPVQATIVTGVTTVGFLPVTFRIPAGQFALLSISGTVTDSIAGQYLEAA